jgi:hypothetical protein
MSISQGNSVPLLANATAGSTGSLTITFPGVNVGTQFTGTISIPGAPATAAIAIEINGQTVASVIGASGYGPIQIASGQTVSFVGTGFTPGQQYQAIGVGVLNQGLNPISVPQPTIVAVNTASPTQELLSGFAITAGSGSALVPLPPGIETLLCELGNPAGGLVMSHTTLQVVGVQSGFNYSAGVPYLPLENSTNLWPFVIPVSGGFDAEVNVLCGNTDGANMILNVFADNQPRQPSDFYQAQQVLQQASAQPNNNTVTVLTGPARLVLASLSSTGFATLNLGTGAHPFLVLNPSGALALPFPPNTILAAGQTITATTTAGAATTTGAVLYEYP